MMEFEGVELAALERDMSRVRPWAQLRVPPVVEKAAVNIKKDWRANATRTAGRHGRHYPYSIDYDSGWVAGGYEAEIGPRMDKPQGSMGEGFEFGGVNQPPHLDGNRAADTEAPRFEAALADLLGGIL